MPRLLIDVRNKILTAEKSTETDENSDEEQRESEPVETDPACLHGSDLTMPGERSQAEEGSE